MNVESIYYKKILEYMDEGVLTIDLEGTITTFNHAAEKILSLKAEDVLGKKFAEAFILLEHADEFTQVLLDTIITSKKITNKSVNITINQEDKILSVTTSFLYNENGEKIGVIVVFSDVTEIEKLKLKEKELHKQLEEEHKKLQKSYIELEEKTESLRLMTEKFNKLKIIGVVIIFAFFSGLIYFVLKNISPQKYISSSTTPKESQIESYAVAEIKPVIKTLGFLGSIDPLNKINIVAPFSGDIKMLKIKYGSSVKKGDLLCKIDPSEIMKALREAEINYIQQKNKYEKLKNWLNSPKVAAAKREVLIAKKNYEDAKNELKIAKTLYKKGIIPKTELDAAIKNVVMSKNSYESAKENLKSVLNIASKDNLKIAKIQLELLKNNFEKLKKEVEKRNIKAPIDGVLLPIESGEDKKNFLTIGSHVTRGQPLFSVGNLTGFSIKININETDITKIKMGMNVNVTIDALGENKVLKGKVSSLSLVPSNSNDKSGVPVYNAIIEIKNIPKSIKNKILLGMSAKADIILYKNNSAVIVPIDCIREENGEFYVLKVIGNKAIKTKVSIGYVGDTWVEIVNGVKPGEKLQRL